MHFGVTRGDVLAAAANKPPSPAVDVCKRAYAVPLELETPVWIWRRRPIARLGHHGFDETRHRLTIGILSRVHAVDHPVLTVGLEENVPALDPIAMQGDHHLAVAPLVRFVRAVVPYRDLAPAVLAGWDLACEVDVVDGVVLYVHSEVVFLRICGDAFRHRPGHQHSILLEPEVPVQASRVMLLHDEPR